DAGSNRGRATSGTCSCGAAPRDTDILAAGCALRPNQGASISSGQTNSTVKSCSAKTLLAAHQSVSEALKIAGADPAAIATATNFRSDASNVASRGSSGNSRNLLGSGWIGVIGTRRQWASFAWLSQSHLKNASPGPG